MSHTAMSSNGFLDDHATINSVQLEQLNSAKTLPEERADAEADILQPLDNIPDGGSRAWCATIGGALVSFCTFGYASSFGVYQDYYVLAGTSTSSNISWIGSLQLFLIFFVGFPAGRLFDAGYFHSEVLLGSILYLFCLFMLSLADPTKYYQILLAQGIGMGIGGGFMLVPALSLQGHYWKKRRSMALGLVVTGSGCGGIIYPIMLNRLISGNSAIGFAWGVRASGFLTLGLLVIAQLLMRARVPGAKERGEQPKPNVWGALRDPSFVFTVFGVFLVYWGLFMPYFYLQLWLNLHGLSSTLAFYTIAILNAASVPGRVIPNTLADYFGALNVVIPVSFIMGALVFVMFGVTNTAAVVVFSILYGFFSGAYIALVPSVFAVLASKPEELGIRMGLGYCIVSFAMLTGTPIDGALLGQGSVLQWPKPIVFSAVVMVAGAGFTCIGRHFLVRVKGSQWT
ncbi:major facilitator superfamily domain-containing protein [Fomitopsis serialis]|uniref:major facilitator superfamily domain-containing protein n=1 Tax=Fomitopsis serialis TaxID=139415 RepID=UPI002008B5AC|nr:major facilitator superfamily domain-containing protein [Neoantrodia serialis]KAH9913285.1 major facilitator superfamily domain-containing protein [Neoantrodia serialis]